MPPLEYCGPYYAGGDHVPTRSTALAATSHDAAIVFTLMTTWRTQLAALDQLNARFQRLSTLHGFNQLGPHERRSEPLWALADELDLMARTLELERPDWTWPRMAYLSD